jgi:hypothetical protein
VGLTEGCHHVGVKPNLERILGDRDSGARAILAHAPERIDQGFLVGLDAEAGLWLGPYGVRRVTTALREGSDNVLRLGLWLPGWRRA